MATPQAISTIAVRAGFTDIPTELVLKIAGSCLALESADPSLRWNFLNAMRKIPAYHEAILDLYKTEYKRLRPHSLCEVMQFDWTSASRIKHLEVIPWFTPVAPPILPPIMSNFNTQTLHTLFIDVTNRGLDDRIIRWDIAAELFVKNAGNATQLTLKLLNRFPTHPPRGKGAINETWKRWRFLVKLNIDGIPRPDHAPLGLGLIVNYGSRAMLDLREFNVIQGFREKLRLYPTIDLQPAAFNVWKWRAVGDGKLAWH